MVSPMRMILVTGGAGFIGSHTVVQLLKQGFRVTIMDNLENSVIEAVHRVRRLVGPQLSSNLSFCHGDLRSPEDLEKLFSESSFDAVIHFAGLKGVGESVAMPRRYFDNNLVGSINLFQVMGKYKCRKMVISSSATVYGEPEEVPCVEESRLQATNPYGRTKLFVEEIARDIQRAEPEWRIILLRYFNPVGAHESGLIGEDPRGVPNNLMPYIQQKIPIKICPRRPGDATAVYASTDKAERELGWKAKYGIEEMCRDLWNWASKNPWGYQGKH